MRPKEPYGEFSQKFRTKSMIDLAAYLEENCPRKTHCFRAADVYPNRGYARMFATLLVSYHLNGRQLIIDDSASIFSVALENPDVRTRKRFQAKRLEKIPEKGPMEIVTISEKEAIYTWED